MQEKCQVWPMFPINALSPPNYFITEIEFIWSDHVILGITSRVNTINARVEMVQMTKCRRAARHFTTFCQKCPLTDQ